MAARLAKTKMPLSKRRVRVYATKSIFGARELGGWGTEAGVVEVGMTDRTSERLSRQYSDRSRFVQTPGQAWVAARGPAYYFLQSLKSLDQRPESREDADGVRIISHGPSRVRSALGPLVASLVLVAALVVAIRDARRGQVVSERPAGIGDQAPAAALVVGEGRTDDTAGLADGTPVPPVAARIQRKKSITAGAVAERGTGSRDAGSRDATVSEGDSVGPSGGDGSKASIAAVDYIAALRAQGETEGLAAFPSPGTNPPKPGVMVPETYVLPEGFVRHFQNTDDGRQLEAILTVSPDYELVDAKGDPVPLGADRIVPPEYAPPDLPVEILDVPATDPNPRDPR